MIRFNSVALPHFFTGVLPNNSSSMKFFPPYNLSLLQSTSFLGNRIVYRVTANGSLTIIVKANKTSLPLLWFQQSLDLIYHKNLTIISDDALVSVKKHARFNTTNAIRQHQRETAIVRATKLLQQIINLNRLIFPANAKSYTMSNLSSPSASSPTESNQRDDDISALSSGFGKICLNRRRLSTLSDLSILLAKEDSGTPSESSGVSGHKKGPAGSWLENKTSRSSSHTKISECSEGDDDLSQSVGSGSGLEKAVKSSEDVFQLLDKVISFRGRNVSHITVEQSVKELCTAYNETDDVDKRRFFNTLSENYGVDQANVNSLANSLITASSDVNLRIKIQEKLRVALVPQYQWLFSQVVRLENGVKFLVDFRTDLLDALEKYKENSFHLKALNTCLRDLIGMWFAVGFLALERVTWQSSCDMLQKISEYEAVHPMRNWTDLKRRVGPYRRCFVFTHGSMPGEPVVVLHTALTDHIPSCIRQIVTNRRMMSLDSDTDMTATSQKEDPEFIDTAIFYSITSTQRGLMGIELGNYLIKRVVRELQSEFPKMNQFSSLSPIPGFKNWIMGELKAAHKNFESQKLLTHHEIESLAAIFDISVKDKAELFAAFSDSLKLNEWHSDEKLVKGLETPLMRLCGQYLVIAKLRGYALDSVANFHLKNGAVIWRLNWLGDNSPRGLGQSCGIMVNYRYFLEDCETNSQNYMEKQTIEISDQVRHLVKMTQTEMTSKF